MPFLPLLAVGAIVLGLGAFAHTTAVKTTLRNHAAVSRYLPRAVSMLILTAHVSELVRVVEHVSIVHISAALLLLAIVVATKTGTEDHMG